MKMPASETAPMAPSLIATRGLSGAVCAAAGEAALAIAAKEKPLPNDVTMGRNVMAALLGVSCSCARGKLDLALSSGFTAQRRRLRLAGRDRRRGGGQRHLALVVRPQQVEEARIVGARGAVPRLIGGQRDGSADDLGLQLLAGILLQERAAEEGGLRALSDHDAAVAAHLHRDLVAERARETGRLLVVDDEPRVVPGRYAAVEKGAVQEHRYDVVTSDAQHRRMLRMQVGDAHALGPVAVNAGVDAPFQRNEAAGMMKDVAVEIEHES